MPSPRSQCRHDQPGSLHLPESRTAHGGGPMTDDFEGFGYDPEIDEPIPTSQPRYVDALLSSYLVTPAYLPPVGQQGTTADPGSPGSCTAWASTYGLATFTAAKAGLVDPSTTYGQASPAFIYIKARQQEGASGPPCGGSGFKFYFDPLAAHRTPTARPTPYSATTPPP